MYYICIYIQICHIDVSIGFTPPTKGVPCAHHCELVVYSCQCDIFGSSTSEKNTLRLPLYVRTIWITPENISPDILLCTKTQKFDSPCDFMIIMMTI
jgi:hypothetical protein